MQMPFDLPACDVSAHLGRLEANPPKQHWPLDAGLVGFRTSDLMGGDRWSGPHGRSQ